MRDWFSLEGSSILPSAEGCPAQPLWKETAPCPGLNSAGNQAGSISEGWRNAVLKGGFGRANSETQEHRPGQGSRIPVGSGGHPAEPSGATRGPEPWKHETKTFLEGSLGRV